MEIQGLPPISGDNISPFGPSNQQLTNQYSALIQDFLNAWSAYEKDPSFQNEMQLETSCSKLLSFLQNNRGQMEQICQQNGWNSGGATGYDSNIQGSINNLSSMRMPPDKPILQMLNESLTSVKAMMTQKA